MTIAERTRVHRAVAPHRAHWRCAGCPRRRCRRQAAARNVMATLTRDAPDASALRQLIAERAGRAASSRGDSTRGRRDCWASLTVALFCGRVRTTLLRSRRDASGGCATKCAEPVDPRRDDRPAERALLHRVARLRDRPRAARARPRRRAVHRHQRLRRGQRVPRRARDRRVARRGRAPVPQRRRAKATCFARLGATEFALATPNARDGRAARAASRSGCATS